MPRDNAGPFSAASARSGTTPFQRMVAAASHQLQQAVFELDVGETAAAAEVDQAVARTLFPDSCVLCSAVVDDVIVRLVDFVSGRLSAAPQDDPVQQFRAMTAGYLDWSFQYPESCRLLFHPALPQLCVSAFARYRGAMYELRRSILVRAAEAGRLRPGQTAPLAEFHFRALIIGIGRIVSSDAAENLDDGQSIEVIRQQCEAALQQHMAMLFVEPETAQKG